MLLKTARDISEIMTIKPYAISVNEPTVLYKE